MRSIWVSVVLGLMKTKFTVTDKSLRAIGVVLDVEKYKEGEDYVRRKNAKSAVIWWRSDIVVEPGDRVYSEETVEEVLSQSEAGRKLYEAIAGANPTVVGSSEVQIGVVTKVHKNQRYADVQVGTGEPEMIYAGLRGLQLRRGMRVKVKGGELCLGR